MSIQRFNRDALRAMPWKNGGGTTCEIASWPPGAGIDDFMWRASIATIVKAAPFSVFPGVDRTIMLLDGGSVQLHADDGSLDHRLDAHAPFSFSGDVALGCTMHGGPSTDFNAMSRRAQCRADVQVLDAAQTAQAAHVLDLAPHGLLMGLHGSWQAGDQQLAAGEGLWWADTPMAWPLLPASDGARLLAVRWFPHD